MDRRADPKVIDGIAAILRGFSGVQNGHELKPRLADIRTVVNLPIDPALPRRILETCPQNDVIIHKDVARLPEVSKN